MKNVNNESEWQNVNSNVNDFQCASLNKSCGNYILRTTNKNNSNIQVKLNVKCENINTDQKLLSQIEISPLLNNNNSTYYKFDGLCGLLNEDSSGCSNYVNQNCETNSNSLFNHWK
jgi:hypothetical protein